MPSQADPQLVSRVRRLPGAAGALAMLAGLLALVGWVLDEPAWLSFLAGSPPMQLGTALGFIALGTALWLVTPAPPSPRRRWLGRLLARLVTLGGLLVLVDALSHPLSAPPFASLSFWIAPNAALCFALLGGALWLMERPDKSRLAQGLALAATLVAFSALCAHILGTTTFSLRLYFPSMGLNSTLLLLLLGLGLFFLQPTRGWSAVLVSEGAGGHLFRRLLPPLLVCPIVLGYMRLAGERAGLYDSAFGAGLMVVSLTVLGVGLVGWGALSLDRAQRNIQRSDARKAVLMEVVQDALVSMDEHGTVLDWNPAAEQIFGYPRSQAIGREMASLIIPERLRAAHRQGLARLLATGQAKLLGKRIELPALRADGSEFPVELTISPVWSFGTPIFTGQLRDITERKQLEEERQAIESIKQADALKEQFLSIISHELRTPINAIMGFSSILDDELVGPLTPRQHAYMRKVLGGTEALLSLVNDLLDMSKIQAGKFSIELAPVYFPDLVSEAVDNLRPLAELKHHTLRLSLPSPMPLVEADAQRVTQVVVNLVNNAIKFTPDGGAITVRACVDEGQLRCEVEDTGIGISPENRFRLFQRFTQLDNSYTRKVGGTGLGLSIAKALVEAHQGCIGVDSQVGQGSTFWFTLPLPASPFPDGPPRPESTR